MTVRKQREKILMFAIFCLVVGFSAQKFFLSDVVVKSKSLKQRIAAQEINLRTALSVQARHVQIEEDAERYSKFFLQEGQEREIIVRLLKETEQAAQESGLTITNLTPDNAPSQVGEYWVYRASIRAQANIEELLNFLDIIQTSSLPIKLDDFSITPRDEEASSLRVRATLSMATP